MISEMTWLMTGQADVVQAIGASAVVMLNALSLVFVVLAQFSWMKLGRSRAFIMAAWIVCVGAPFLVSFVPARLFVDWSEASSVVTTYRDELIHHINVDERVAKLRDTCIMMKNEKRSMQQ